MKPRIRPLTEHERAIYSPRRRWLWCVDLGDGRAWFGRDWREAWAAFCSWMRTSA